MILLNINNVIILNLKNVHKNTILILLEYIFVFIILLKHILNLFSYTLTGTRFRDFFSDIELLNAENDDPIRI
jgi:hypothetical protein